MDLALPKRRLAESSSSAALAAAAFSAAVGALHIKLWIQARLSGLRFCNSAWKGGACDQQMQSAAFGANSPAACGLHAAGRVAPEVVRGAESQVAVLAPLDAGGLDGLVLFRQLVVRKARRGSRRLLGLLLLFAALRCQEPPQFPNSRREQSTTFWMQAEPAPVPLLQSY